MQDQNTNHNRPGLEGLRKMAQERAHRVADLQRAFLAQRRQALHQIHSALAYQISSGMPNIVNAAPAVFARPALITSKQLDEFGRGSIARCLGPEYEQFEGRRVPRIPNGDLKLMSRVISINGQRGDPRQSASVITEYDVPVDAWFIRHNPSRRIPTSVYLEIALQPCGILSAYLGTLLLFPQQEFYFRNLDGEARLLKELDLRGRTITCHANLDSTVVSGNTIIQKFRFRLLAGEEVFYEGSSVFGYFPPELMQRQAGLDNGLTSVPRCESDQALRAQMQTALDVRQIGSNNPAYPFLQLPSGPLQFLSEVAFALDGGTSGKGYAVGSKAVDGRDWFYDCHFYQDPVMPGSLGVEAVYQALQALLIMKGAARGMRSPRFSLDSGLPLNWKYRGQIIPQNKMMKVDIDLHTLEQDSNGVLAVGNASLWVDQMRIYEITNAAVRILESEG